MTELQILENRLKRAEKTFEEGLQQYDQHLSDDTRSKEENESDLDKLRVLIKRLQTAYPPVIEKYEEMTGSNTVDQKIEELEKRQRDTEFQFVDATHALKRKFPPQQPAASVNNIVVQAPAAVQQPFIVQHNGGRLQEIKMPDFHGDRAEYPKFKSMFDMNIHERGDLSDACKLSSFNPNPTKTKQDGENLKRFPRGEEPSSKEDSSQECTRSRPLMTTEIPVSQRSFVIQIARELVTNTTSGNRGRLRYEFLLQEEEKQLFEKNFQQSRGLFDQQCVTVSADREVSNVRARACVDTIKKLMQRQQTFGPNQNKIPSDGDYNKKSDGQTASLGRPQTALKSSKVTEVRDEPANQQLPHAQEEMPPAPKNGLSDANEASEALKTTETQEASEVNNVPYFSFQIAGCLCVQGEQILQVETSAFEDFLRYTNPTAEQCSSTQTSHYFALVPEALKSIFSHARCCLSTISGLPFAKTLLWYWTKSQTTNLFCPGMVTARNQDSSSRSQQPKIHFNYRCHRFLCYEMHSQQGSVKSWQSMKKTKANIVLLNYLMCLFMCVVRELPTVSFISPFLLLFQSTLAPFGIA